jgi:hypothetical protein
MSPILPPKMPVVIEHCWDGAGIVLRASVQAQAALVSGDYAEALQCLRIARNRISTLITKLDASIAETVRAGAQQ